MQSPIEKQHPAEIVAPFGDKDLSKRQQRLLDMLPGYGARVVVKKRDVSMLDLSAMTAKTGDEFALFTRKGERMVVRGNEKRIPLSEEELIKLHDDGYRFSGHTHRNR